MTFRTSPIRKMAVAATSLAAVAALAAPVSAQGAADTELTLTVNESGFLSITAPATAAAAASVDVTGGTAAFDIDGLVISDARTTPGIFTATAVSENLTEPEGSSISATNMVWATDQVLDVPDENKDVTGAVAGLGGPLAAPGAVIALGATSTNEMVRYDVSGIVTVTIPAATPAGVYTATMTTSVQ